MSIDLTKLSEPLDEKAITQHPTKTYLSSIKAIYVTERFNDVFGIGKWTQKVQTEHVNHETGMVVVKVTFEVPELNIYYESFGGNDNGGSNNKNFDLGDAYKGATTDALTKIGSYLGVAIDVFKGLNDNKKPSQNDNRPWLTEDGFKWLMSLDATKEDIKKAFSTRRMKKDYRTQLEAKL